MANNRLLLMCQTCGEQFLLGQRLLDPYHIWPPEGVEAKETLALRLNDFFDAHGDCGGGGAWDVFSLEYESRRDYTPLLGPPDTVR